MDGWESFIEGMKLLEYLNIKHSSVYITRSSSAVEDKKNQNYPAVLGYKAHTMKDIQLITSIKLKYQTVNQLRNQLN
jgi:hypothetical protein